MKPTRFLCLLLPLALLLAALSPALAGAFSFLHLSDPHFGTGGSQQAFAEIAADLPWLLPKPEFILLTGDITETGSQSEFQAFQQAAKDLPLPVYAVPGNHDVRWSDGGLLRFAEFTGRQAPYSFDPPGTAWHFIALDTSIPLEHHGLIDPSRARWLAQDLQRLKPDTPLLVFLHHPPAYPEDDYLAGADLLFSALSRFRTKLILAGHVHVWNTWQQRGAALLVTASLYDNRGYSLVTLSDKDVIVQQVTHKSGKLTLTHLARFQLPTDPDPQESPPSQPSPPTFPGEKWRLSLDGAIQGTPCVSGDRAFVGTWAGDVYALRLSDGRELWRRNLRSPIHAPLAADDRLVFCPTAAGLLFALDRATGRIAGRRRLGAPALAPPALDQDRLLASAGRTLFCLDRRTGRTRWNHEFAGLIQAKPAVIDGLTAVGAWDNTFRALDLRTGEARWQLRLGPSIYFSPAIASPALWKNLVIISHIPGKDEHSLRAVQAADGGLAWSAPLPAGYASPALFGDNLLAVSLGGRVSCLSAADGHPLWQQELNEPVYDSSPVLLGDAIYLMTLAGRLICLDPDSGQERWRRQALSPYVFASPASSPEHNLLLLAGMNGLLLALDPTAAP